MKKSESLLTELAFKGCDRALNTLIVNCYDKLLSTARGLLWDPSLCQDCVQDALIRAEKLFRKRWNGKCTFYTFAHGVLRFVCLEYRRKENKRSSHELPLQEGVLEFKAKKGHSAHTKDLLALIDRELSHFPKDFKAVFWLFHSGYKHREIAEMLGVPCGTVRRRLHDVRKHLQQELRDRL